MSKKHPILIVSSHSSTHIPKELRKIIALSEFEIRRESDLYTDQIFKQENAYFLEGNISRLITDLNRSPEHIEMEYQLASDGAVISVNENAEPIYITPPSMDSIFERIKKFHDPFHEKIEAIKPKVKFLIDGHSMLSQGPKTKDDANLERPDICVGNFHYIACSRVLTNKIVDFFRSKGYKTTINKPYEGRYIIGYHCRRDGLNGVTLEINRKLYMNEETLEPNPEGIKKLNEVIKELVEILCIELNCSKL